MDHKIPLNPDWPRKKTPESSMIAEMAYNQKDTLYVHFSTNNSVYAYSPVQPKTWKSLEEAISSGAYFAKHIKNNKTLKAKSL